MKNILTTLLLTLSLSCIAQVNLDSLWNVWNDETQADTIRLKAIYEITWNVYLFSQPDSAFYFAGLQYDFANSIKNKKWMAEALRTQGASFHLQGNFKKALEKFLKGLKINEGIGDKGGIAASLTNIGIIYEKQENYKEALKYHENSLKIFEEIGHKRGIANALSNIGLCYRLQKKYKEASFNLIRSLKISEEIGDKNGIAGVLNNIGGNYFEQGNYETALIYHKKSLKISEKLGLKKLIATYLSNIAYDYNHMKEYHYSIIYLKDALTISEDINSLALTNDLRYTLYKTYKKLGDSKKALEIYELHIASKDTLAQQDAKEAATELMYKYRYETKAKVDSVDNLRVQQVKDKEIARQQAELEVKRDHQIILYGGLSLAILFSIFMINRFRVTNRQKEIIETKQKQITDNINYANRIQKTLLPEDKLMNEFFSEFFALYKPKDIVGGDFYWYRSFGDMAAIACVDCTGHGVAGGFMSMMGSLLLDKIIHNNKLNPSDILEQLSNDIIRVLKQDAGGEIQDGMDLSLCIIDKKNMKLHFSGARNGILIIDKENISHYKADLLPVGGAFSRKSRKMSRKFTTQSISITKDSWIIMHSDGYYDQLGGSKTMSMEPEKYKEIIQSAVKTNKDKKEFLMQEFEQWREDFPQVDDLLVIGLRV